MYISCLICKFLKGIWWHSFVAILLWCVRLCHGDLLLRVCLPWITFLAGAALWECFLYLVVRIFRYHRCAFQILFNSILRSFASCTPMFPSYCVLHSWVFRTLCGGSCMRLAVTYSFCVLHPKVSSARRSGHFLAWMRCCGPRGVICVWLLFVALP